MLVQKSLFRARIKYRFIACMPCLQLYHYSIAVKPIFLPENGQLHRIKGAKHLTFSSYRGGQIIEKSLDHIDVHIPNNFHQPNIHLVRMYSLENDIYLCVLFIYLFIKKPFFQRKTGYRPEQTRLLSNSSSFFNLSLLLHPFKPQKTERPHVIFWWPNVGLSKRGKNHHLPEKGKVL